MRSRLLFRRVGFVMAGASSNAAAVERNRVHEVQLVSESARWRLSRDPMLDIGPMLISEPAFQHQRLLMDGLDMAANGPKRHHGAKRILAGVHGKVRRPSNS